MGLITLRCAQTATPNGGPKDEDPPELVRSLPETGTLNFAGDEVRFVFNEPIQLPTFDKEIFISPYTVRPKIILSDNAKRLRIQFSEPLRPNATYVVTLTGIKDLNERNPIEESITLAFSTGDVLDSMEIQGRILGPTLGRAVKGMTLLLFDADSIVEGNYLRKRPAYVSKAGDDGRFRFQYLRKAPYRLLGVLDDDQTNTYSQPGELVALPPDSILVFPEDTTLLELELLAFLPDAQAPRLQSYAWIHPEALALRMSENLDLSQARLHATDTLGRDSLPVPAYTWLGGQDFELLVAMPRPRDSVSYLHLLGLADSLGNPMDTVLMVTPFRSRKPESPLLKPPLLLPSEAAYEAIAVRALSLADSARFSLSDTARYDSTRQFFGFRLAPDGFRFRLLPHLKPDSLRPLLLGVSGAFLASDDSLLQDSLFRYPVKWFDQEEYGNLSGSLRFDSTYQGPTVLQLLNKDQKVVRSTRDTTFAYKTLPAGTYTARVILDTDSNGVWTPGRLWPPSLPERIFLDPTPITVRANWDFDNHLIKVSLDPAKAPADSTASGDKAKK